MSWNKHTKRRVHRERRGLDRWNARSSGAIFGKFKLVSEEDSGIYDALNKGIQLATGEIIAFLHTDDFYITPHAVSHMVEAMLRKDADAAWGDLVYVDQKIPIESFADGSLPHTLPESSCAASTPPHPTFFARKAIYERCGVSEPICASPRITS